MTTTAGRAAAAAPPAPSGPRGASARAAWPDEGGTSFGARSWGALAVGGGALVTVAVAVPHLASHVLLATALLLLAAATAVGSVATLRGPGRAARAAAGAATATGAAVLLSAPSWGLVGTAAVTAGALTLGGAVLLGVAARTPVGRADRTTPGPWARLGVLTVGALLASAATVHGLAATEAGAHAVPHGSHGLLLDPGTHGHHG
ncbi:hypothetical protein [Cellulomonas sp. B6]|uniref:hypothetical protein n=1 Tax=Cellulomonas sp. B6 TaxID=1295626 RepID=UPI00073CA0ED|nr:hypothetical protein [Cellulomonas sp. B6]KSW20715.1 hypothetical protein ATM99_15435 [Cellulomonas sp. B6]